MLVEHTPSEFGGNIQGETAKPHGNSLASLTHRTFLSKFSVDNDWIQSERARALGGGVSVQEPRAGVGIQSIQRTTDRT